MRWCSYLIPRFDYNTSILRSAMLPCNSAVQNLPITLHNIHLELGRRSIVVSALHNAKTTFVVTMVQVKLYGQQMRKEMLSCTTGKLLPRALIGKHWDSITLKLHEKKTHP